MRWQTPRPFRRPRRFLSLIALCAALSGCGADRAKQQGSEPQPYPERQTATKPNVVVVMTDDQTVGQYRIAMPFTRAFFAERGTTFSEAIATPPLCCPARAGFLTGQYPHNHGVFRNTPGYPSLRNPENTLPVWLDRAGYRTGMIGKYLNGYDAVAGAAVAPGWDFWVNTLGYAPYFGYRLSIDGEVEQTRGEYSTERFTDEAIDFATGSARRRQSFFLWLAPYAPHFARADSGPCAGLAAQPPSARALRRYARTPLPEPDAFDERDLSDKPDWLAAKKPLAEGALRELTLHWRCALAATRAVDRAFERLVGALRRSGVLDETLVVFTSDNGLAFGENRIVEDKRLPYEPILRVPLAIAPPAGGPPPRGPTRSSSELVGTIDLAPTLLDYAGARPCTAGGECRTPDGRSLRPLLTDRGGWPRDRGLLLELTDLFGYAAIRTPRFLYSVLRKADSRRLPRPEVEVYDLARDPSELQNLWQTDRARAERLRAKLEPRLRRLRDCAGSEPAGGRPACE
jgi:arylsulfatase A-like enzyme